MIIMFMMLMLLMVMMIMMVIAEHMQPREATTDPVKCLQRSVNVFFDGRGFSKRVVEGEVSHHLAPLVSSHIQMEDATHKCWAGLQFVLDPRPQVAEEQPTSVAVYIDKHRRRIVISITIIITTSTNTIALIIRTTLSLAAIQQSSSLSSGIGVARN